MTSHKSCDFIGKQLIVDSSRILSVIWKSMVTKSIDYVYNEIIGVITNNTRGELLAPTKSSKYFYVRLGTDANCIPKTEKYAQIITINNRYGLIGFRVVDRPVRTLLNLIFNVLTAGSRRT